MMNVYFFFVILIIFIIKKYILDRYDYSKVFNHLNKIKHVTNINQSK
jgi:hypothetical protein